MKRAEPETGETTDLVVKARHHRSGFNGQVWHIIRLDVRHAVSTQMLGGLDCFPSRFPNRTQKVALNDSDRLEDKTSSMWIMKTVTH